MSSNQPIVRKSLWKRKSFLFVAIPMLIGLITFVYFATVQVRSSQRIDAEIQRLRVANVPVDSESQNAWFIANTSREHSDAWAEILLMSSVGSDVPDLFEKMPYIGTAKVPTTIDPNQPWDSEPLVAQWVEMMRPLIEKIRTVTDSKNATWQPLSFDGVATLLEPLQSSRSIARTLQVEIEHALYVGDSERTMRGLRSLDGLVYAFDWRICLVSDLVTTALRNVQYSMIQRSLNVDIWTEEQLLELTSQVSVTQDVSKRWREVIEGERALMFDEVTNRGARVTEGQQGGVAFVLSIPSVRERLLMAYSQLAAVGDQGINSLAKNAEELEKQIFREGRSVFSVDDIGINLLFPAVEAYAAALIRNEDSRRLTLTALAIKRYQLANGEFPERLVQLKDAGLKPADWTTVGGSVFGYDKDEAAYLWSYSFRDTKVMPAVRPAVEENGTEQLVTIR